MLSDNICADVQTDNYDIISSEIDTNPAASCQKGSIIMCLMKREALDVNTARLCFSR